MRNASKGLQGSIYDVYPDGVHSQNVDRMPEVGTIADTGDGRQFMFVHSSSTSAFTKGYAISSADFQAISNVGNAAIAAYSDTVTVTGLTATDNQFKGAFLEIIGGDGTGLYPIHSHKASSDSTVVLQLKNWIPGAVDADWTGRIIYPKGNRVKPGGYAAVGVCIQDIAASSGDKYFWVQTQGLALVYCQDGTASGYYGLMTETDGKFNYINGIDEAYLAIAANKGSANEGLLPAILTMPVM